jgi:hypothetical protein
MRPFFALLAVALFPLVVSAQDPPAGQRVYVCGHSFHVPMAAPLEHIARAAGIKDHVTAGKAFLGGSSVTKHWEVPEDKSAVKAAIRTGNVDVLTVSPNGKLLPDDGIASFTAFLLAHNPKGRVLVQASWAAMDGQRGRAFKNMDRDTAQPAEVRKRVEPINKKLNEQVQALHDTYREKTGRQVVFLVPVGEAVLQLRERVVHGKVPGVAKQSELFRDDLGHGKAPIYVLAAYCHYAIIYGRTPVGLPAPEELKKAGLGLNTEPLNRVLQEVAWDAVTHERLSGVKAPPQDKPFRAGAGR